MEVATIGLARRAHYLGVLTCLVLFFAAPASAETCNNPDALGTSRTIVVDPREYPRIGTMQY